MVLERAGKLAGSYFDKPGLPFFGPSGGSSRPVLWVRHLTKNGDCARPEGHGGYKQSPPTCKHPSTASQLSTVQGSSSSQKPAPLASQAQTPWSF